MNMKYSLLNLFYGILILFPQNKNLFPLWFQMYKSFSKKFENESSTPQWIELPILKKLYSNFFEDISEWAN